MSRPAGCVGVILSLLTVGCVGGLFGSEPDLAIFCGKTSGRGFQAGADIACETFGTRAGEAAWSWGDGAASTGTRVTHAYQREGTYEVSATVGTMRATLVVGIDGIITRSGMAPVVQRDGSEPANAARIPIEVREGLRFAELEFSGLGSLEVVVVWIFENGTRTRPEDNVRSWSGPFEPGVVELRVWIERDLANVPRSLEREAPYELEARLGYSGYDWPFARG